MPRTNAGSRVDQTIRAGIHLADDGAVEQVERLAANLKTVALPERERPRNAEIDIRKAWKIKRIAR